MPYGKVNPTGCTERYGLIQVRLDFFLESDDVRFGDQRFYQVDEASAAFKQGYKGKIDEFGSPADIEAYQAWQKALPKAWLTERCFHHHFIYLDPYTLRDEQITDAIGLHLPNFYKAWTEEWDKVQGGMRHGWDVACRRPRPVRYNLKEPELYDTRKLDCLSAVDILKTSEFATQVTETGETFPSTDIDVGSAALDRNTGYAVSGGGGVGTIVGKDNAANDAGTLDTVEAYFGTAQATNEVKVGTFSFSGTTGTCRDAQSLGSVSAGAQQFTGLDIDIASGDYIGADGRESKKTVTIDYGTSGGSGVLTAYNQLYCDATDSGAFTLYDADAILSLYGTGETSVDVYTSDALRRIAKVSVYAADSIRTLRAVQSYEADAIRALQGTQTYCADALRMLCAEDFYAADTVRVVVLTLNDVYPADTRRQIQASDSYRADALRKLLAGQSYSADSLRRNVESAVYAADTFRLVYADAIYQADALRAILGWQTYDADTLRPIQEDQHDRYPADTKRLIYIVQPFIGRPFVLEIRNQSGQLLAIPRLLSGKLTQALNAPDVLRATIPADDPAREHITPANLLYVRDDSGAIVSICSPVICERESQ